MVAYVLESAALRLWLMFSGALPFPPSCLVVLLAVRGFLMRQAEACDHYSEGGVTAHPDQQ